MITRSAIRFDLDIINPDSIRLFDICESLSKLCRYNGHCIGIYTVAQHSMLCADYALPEFKLSALTHDFAEAYTCDLISPHKRKLPEFKEIEEQIHYAIALRYELPLQIPDEVHELDLRAMATERRDLLPEHNTRLFECWQCLDDVEPFEKQLHPNYIIEPAIYRDKLFIAVKNELQARGVTAV